MTVDIRMKLFKMSLDRPSDEVLSTVQRTEMVVMVPVPPVVVDVIGWNAVDSDNSCSHLRGKLSVTYGSSWVFSFKESTWMRFSAVAIELYASAKWIKLTFGGSMWMFQGRHISYARGRTATPNFVSSRHSSRQITYDGKEKAVSNAARSVVLSPAKSSIPFVYCGAASGSMARSVQSDRSESGLKLAADGWTRPEEKIERGHLIEI
ncbi:hypothetical protein ARMSODRAFT_983855 [Armillaria solidipes]|uniref:Uncharacterized protein n=1 Tax=Armillaria solidipes TaxID=1076256 RepID=A0A2H3B3L7_9AGAR|nr:hypothetical protein ARMSODRAFT_983855 [Armillaria solidipes]